MLTLQNPFHEALLTDGVARGESPTDSSQILLELLTIANACRQKTSEQMHHASDSVISREALGWLLTALWSRDAETVKHSQRVARLATGLATYLGWEGRMLKVLETAALLHDVGKIGVPDHILFKPGRLTPDESDLMSLHYRISGDVLQAFGVNRDVLRIIRQSRYGYKSSPEERTSGEQCVHQGARILAVADAYDSLAADRAYRSRMPHQEILQLLIESSADRFDGDVVCALSRWFSRGDLRAQDNADLTLEEISGLVADDDTVDTSSLGRIFSYLYLLESMYDGFYLLDADLRFGVWNWELERLLGHSADEMLGTRWSSRRLTLCDETEQPLRDEQCPLYRGISAGRPALTDLKLRHANGNWINAEIQTIPLIDNEGQLLGVAEIFRDVTRDARKPIEYRKLKLAAIRDALTSVANRGELETQMTMLLSAFSDRKKSSPFSVIFLDIDFFKNINDTYGHAIGDQVLVDLARLLQQETHPADVVGRYGGEEFVVLCPETKLEDAVRKAEKLRVAIERSSIGDMKRARVTASFGVTEAEVGDSVQSILRRADKALYDAKESGRNRTCSLTNTEWMASVDKRDENAQMNEEPFTFSANFQAFVAADMVVYKLGGFVHDLRAQLVEVTPQRAVVRIGDLGLWPFWGSIDERRPVELELEIGEPGHGSGRPHRVAARQVTVQAKVRPLGWVRNSHVFQLRAKRVLKVLRSYFAAD